MGIRQVVACPTGLEPVTYGLEDRCSNPTELRADLVHPEGVEPTRPYGQRILSPLRLPIPPWMLLTRHHLYNDS